MIKVGRGSRRENLEHFTKTCQNEGMYEEHQGKVAGKLIHNFVILAALFIIGVCIFFVVDKVENGLFHGSTTQAVVCDNESGVSELENAGIGNATKCKPKEATTEEKIKEIYKR